MRTAYILTDQAMKMAPLAGARYSKANFKSFVQELIVRMRGERDWCCGLSAAEATPDSELQKLQHDASN